MNELNKTETTWWVRNKKKVLIIGGVAVAAGVGVLVFKNKDALIALLKRGKRLADTVPQIAEPTVTETASEVAVNVDTQAIIVSKSLNNGLPFPVKGSVRDLPNDWHPSAKKVAQAVAMGIELGDHQTLVDPYMKNAA